MMKSKKMETLYFFAWPAIITGANFFITAPWNFVVRLAMGRGTEADPFFHTFVTLAGAALVWAGWRGWKKAKQLDLLDPKSDFLGLPRIALLARKKRLQGWLIVMCVLFAQAWVFPGPVMLLLMAGVVAIFTRRYLIARAELQFVRAREGLV